MLTAWTAIMIVLAFWQYQKQNNPDLMVPEILFTIAGILTVLSGLSLISSSAGGSMAVMAFGVFEFIIALVGVLKAGGPAKGLSQFKAVYHRMKGKHEHESD